MGFMTKNSRRVNDTQGKQGLNVFFYRISFLHFSKMMAVRLQSG